MTTSMLDQIIFNLRCGHHVVLGRLANKSRWTCKDCGEETDLAAEPYKKALERDLDTATQLDFQAKVRGKKR
jgi:Mrp family chromosome partitioning ATPase